MKTPREILLERHKNSNGKLDAIRQAAVKQLRGGAHESRRRHVEDAPALWRGLRLCWQELVWPCRRVWLGLAAAWLAMGILRIAEHPGALPAGSASSNLLASQALLNDLLADNSGRFPLKP